MKKFKTITIFILFTIFFAGCLQVETTLNVKKDGSGTINEKVLFSKTFVTMIKEFAQSFDDSASADTEEFSFFKEDEIKADAKDYGENVVYVSHKLISENNWEGYEAVYSFDDISKVKIEPDPGSKVDIGTESSEDASDEEYYFFKFVKGPTSELIINRPEMETSIETEEEVETEESEQNNEEMGEEFLAMMKGMKISVGILVDGQIVNTNATYVQGSKVTLFEMDLGEMMKNKEAFKEFKSKEPKNIDELKEYLEKFKGMKIETEKPVSVKFE